MSKLIYQPQNDFFIFVNLINFENSINLDTFKVEINDEKRNRIENYLNDSKNANIVCFPEFTYCDSLYDLYTNFSIENEVIIIGGSGLEEYQTDKYFAYCPIFFPNGEIAKVYKQFITVEEKTYSKGKLVGYPNPTQRDYKIITEELEYVISIFICYDFLQCEYKLRTDVVFIPQLEKSPQHFINRGNNIVQGFDNFVFGVNNFTGSSRSIGFTNLNSSLISAFSSMKFRKQKYVDSEGEKLNEHHTIIYDVKEEKIIKLRLNLAKPVPKPYNFSYQNHEPNIMIL